MGRIDVTLRHLAGQHITSRDVTSLRTGPGRDEATGVCPPAQARPSLERGTSQPSPSRTCRWEPSVWPGYRRAESHCGGRMQTQRAKEQSQDGQIRR